MLVSTEKNIGKYLLDPIVDDLLQYDMVFRQFLQLELVYTMFCVNDKHAHKLLSKLVHFEYIPKLTTFPDR